MPATCFRNLCHSLLLVSACSFTVGGYAASALQTSLPADTDSVPEATTIQQWDYDEVRADVPREKAQIASVALAEIHIALRRARQQAEQTLCDGQWGPSGQVFRERGPAFQESSQPNPGQRSWLYRALRHPHAISCGGISRSAFFREVSLHLPEWIEIRPAGQATAFRQGRAAPVDQSATFAAR